MIRAIARRCPRPLLPASLLAASISACARGEGPLVAFLGDSLTSGWRLPEEQAYPALVAEDLARRGRPIRALNAGSSGDTAAQGLARLEPVLRQRPDVLVVALGINDALRGLPVEETEAALQSILDGARSSGARLVLVGFRARGPASPSLRAFEAMYARLAAERKLAFVPDLLDGVAGDPELLFGDGLHPNAAGQMRLAANVTTAVELVLAEVRAVPGR
jgi:acyl-CoA thioesterase-1